MRPITILVIPDSQTLLSQSPGEYDRVAQWIISQSENLDAVVHVGDVVDCGADDVQQFQFASAAHQRILDAGVPLVVAAGNHDYDDRLHQSRALSQFDDFIGAPLLRQREFAASYAAGEATNSYFLVDSPAGRILLLTLEFGPREDVVRWANARLDENPLVPTFLVTHSYLDADARRTSSWSRWHPRTVRGSMDAMDGAELWAELVQRHDQIIAVFSGHQIPGITSYRVDQTLGGYGVLQTYQNWQCAPEHLRRCARMVQWDPEQSTVTSWVVDAAGGDEVAGPGYRYAVAVGKGAPEARYPETPPPLAEWPESTDTAS